MWESTCMAYDGSQKKGAPRIMSVYQLEIRECEEKIAFSKSEIEKTKSNMNGSLYE
jgi:hypothetical protein